LKVVQSDRTRAGGSQRSRRQPAVAWGIAYLIVLEDFTANALILMVEDVEVYLLGYIRDHPCPLDETPI